MSSGSAYGTADYDDDLLGFGACPAGFSAVDFPSGSGLAPLGIGMEIRGLAIRVLSCLTCQKYSSPFGGVLSVLVSAISVAPGAVHILEIGVSILLRKPLPLRVNW